MRHLGARSTSVGMLDCQRKLIRYVAVRKKLLAALVDSRESMPVVHAQSN